MRVFLCRLLHAFWFRFSVKVSSGWCVKSKLGSCAERGLLLERYVKRVGRLRGARFFVVLWLTTSTVVFVTVLAVLLASGSQSAENFTWKSATIGALLYALAALLILGSVHREKRNAIELQLAFESKERKRLKRAKRQQADESRRREYLREQALNEAARNRARETATRQSQVAWVRRIAPAIEQRRQEFREVKQGQLADLVEFADVSCALMHREVDEQNSRIRNEARVHRESLARARSSLEAAEMRLGQPRYVPFWVSVEDALDALDAHYQSASTLVDLLSKWPARLATLAGDRDLLAKMEDPLFLSFLVESSPWGSSRIDADGRSMTGLQRLQSDREMFIDAHVKSRGLKDFLSPDPDFEKFKASHGTALARLDVALGVEQVRIEVVDVGVLLNLEQQIEALTDQAFSDPHFSQIYEVRRNTQAIELLSKDLSFRFRSLSDFALSNHRELARLAARLE